jgi:hypothetical protein
MEAYQMSATLAMFVLALAFGQVSGVLVIGTIVWLVNATLI